jgi:type II secretion system protein N
MNPRLQALVDRLRAFEPSSRQRRVMTWAGYPLFALFVAALTFFWSVPRERVKDRLEAALSADVTSGQALAIGMDVEIGDLSLTLFTGAGFKATDVVLRTRPLVATEKPSRYIVDDVRVRLGLFSTLFGHPSYTFKAHALSGTVSGRVSGNGEDTKLLIEVDKLVLTGVPAIAAATGGLPVEGVVSGKLDVLVPRNMIANCNGTIDITIDDAGIGDGKAKLTVPNDPFLSAGLTFPKIRLGKLAGQIIIDKGRARFESVRVHSADGDASIEGYAELHDPLGTSQLHAYVKFRPTDALVKREPTVEIMNNSMAAAKRSDGFIGLQITGPLSGLFYLPSKDPPFGVTSRDEPASKPLGTAPQPTTPAFVPPPNTPSFAPPPEPATATAPPSAPPPLPPGVTAPPPIPPPPPSGAEGARGADRGAVETGRGASDPSRETPPPTPGPVGPPPPMRTMRPEQLENPPGRE